MMMHSSKSSKSSKSSIDVLSKETCRSYFTPLSKDDFGFEQADTAWRRAKHRLVTVEHRKKLAADFRVSQEERRERELKRYKREKEEAEAAEQEKQRLEDEKKRREQAARQALAEQMKQKARLAGGDINRDVDDGSSSDDDEGVSFF